MKYISFIKNKRMFLGYIFSCFSCFEVPMRREDNYGMIVIFFLSRCYLRDISPHQVRKLNLLCPRILNYKENLEVVLLEMMIISQTKINHIIKELVPFHHSCFLISSMREEVARKWRHSNNC